VFSKSTKYEMGLNEIH